jgi:hypothetical protein
MSAFQSSRATAFCWHGWRQIGTFLAIPPSIAVRKNYLSRGRPRRDRAAETSETSETSQTSQTPPGKLLRLDPTRAPGHTRVNVKEPS